MNNCSQNGSEGRSADSSAAVEPHNLHYQERDRFSLDREVCIATMNGSPVMANELPNVKRECASPEIYVGASGTKKPDFEFSKFKISTFPAKVIEVDSMDGGLSNKKQIKVENSKKVSEWKKFIRDPSTKENQYEKQDEKNVDSGALSFITEVLQAPNKSIKESQTIESLCPIKSSENHGRAAKLNKTIPMPDVRARAAVTEEVVHYGKSEIDAKSSSQQQQSTGSLCLVSEMSGSHYRKLLSDPAGSSVVTNSASSRSTKKKKIFVSNKLGSSKISSVHPDVRNLASEVVERACNVQIDDVQQNENAFEEKRKKSNSVGETGSCKRCSCKKSKCLKLYCECFTAGVYCTGSCNCQDCFNKPAHEDTVRETRRRIASRNPLAFAHKNKWSTYPASTIYETGCNSVRSLVPPLASEVVERACNVQIDDVQLNENAFEKKRKKSDSAGETDSCKRCSCKKSKCLKLYCECFTAGVYCIGLCNCQGCFNKPAHEDIVVQTRRLIESRNPFAFVAKRISSANKLNKIPASSGYKRGCNCMKSVCLKKYCECFQGGVGCSRSCTCKGCENTFGQKEGIEGIVFEEAKILNDCASGVGSPDEFQITDHENKAPHEHSNVKGPQVSLLPCGQSLQSRTSLQSNDVDHTILWGKDNAVLDGVASEAL